MIVKTSYLMMSCNTKMQHGGDFNRLRCFFYNKGVDHIRYPWQFLTIAFRTFVCYDLKKEMILWQEYALWRKTLISANTLLKNHVSAGSQN
ncbi:MAG: hypothetical protein LUG90_09610, partial [Clostridiaceae bacterium]|nr:hypothetical protein [Clostridiaceae bacterium]